MKPQVAEAIEQHRAAGSEFEAGGVRSFVREQGEGDPVVLMHGIPVSSFLYRKVLPLLAERGLRGVAFDLPGLGLAEKPEDFDYSWSGLGRWTGEAIDALGIERCHLVLHDIGGPIGLEWALRNRDRVLSLTVLDTLIDVAHFRRVWTMDLAAPPLIGPLWVATIRPPVARWLFYLQGIADRASTPAHEVDAHIALLHHDRRRELVPEDRPRVRAHRGEGALLHRGASRGGLARDHPLGRPRSRARGGPPSGVRGRSRHRGAGDLGQALPPGGPGPAVADTIAELAASG